MAEAKGVIVGILLLFLAEVAWASVVVFLPASKRTLLVVVAGCIGSVFNGLGCRMGVGYLCFSREFSSSLQSVVMKGRIARKLHIIGD